MHYTYRVFVRFSTEGEIPFHRLIIRPRPLDIFLNTHGRYAFVYLPRYNWVRLGTQYLCPYNSRSPISGVVTWSTSKNGFLDGTASFLYVLSFLFPCVIRLKCVFFEFEKYENVFENFLGNFLICFILFGGIIWIVVCKIVRLCKLLVQFVIVLLVYKKIFISCTYLIISY